MKISINNIHLVSRYINDKQGGEMIESSGYTKKFLNMESPTSQEELDEICKMFNNHVLSEDDGSLYNNKGEIIYDFPEAKPESMMNGDVFTEKIEFEEE